jgi:hypothetical protein
MTTSAANADNRSMDAVGRTAPAQLYGNMTIGELRDCVLAGDMNALSLFEDRVYAAGFDEAAHYALVP